MDIASLFGDQTIELTCPNDECKQKFSEPAKVVLKGGADVVCPHCNRTITINLDSDSFKEVNESLRKIESLLKNFGR